MRAALIGNQEDTDPGLVGHCLRAHGFSFIEFARETPASWPDLPGLDLVVSLGSSWSTYWPDIAVQTGAERDLLRRAHNAGVPVLGICFGGQQLAHTLGGSVQRSQMHEIGWFSVESLRDKGNSEADPFSGTWFQWHYDRFEAPGTAAQLAASQVSQQAFMAGRSLGLQFHPEVTESIVAHWSRGGGAKELSDAGIDRDELLDQTRAMVTDTTPRTERLVQWFLDTAATAAPPAQAHETQR